MPPPNQALPDDVLAAIRHGNTIEAIKRLRAATGIGLKEARDRVRRASHGGDPELRPVAQGGASPVPEAAHMPEAVRDAMDGGRKLDAIRLLRERSGLGLKEAKDAVERDPGGLQVPRWSTASPGEVPRSGRGGWLMVAIVVAAAVLLYRVFFGDPG